MLFVRHLRQLDQGLLAQFGRATSLDLLHSGQSLFHLVGVLQQAVGQIEGLGLSRLDFGDQPQRRWYLVL